MKAEETISLHYFIPRKGHFWRYADEGTVIEWRQGFTICHTKELLDLLDFSSKSTRLPALSVVLLLLSATSRTLGNAEKNFFLGKLLEDQDANTAGFKKVVDDAFSFLHIVSSLPQQLRTGPVRRAQLLRDIFGEIDSHIDSKELRRAIGEMQKGTLDHWTFVTEDAPATKQSLVMELGYFAYAFQKYPTVQQLTIKLRTGVENMPIADGVVPETLSGNLLDQLLEDRETTGIAALAKRLIAVFNIPMQAKGSSDMPLGGISDITNRGNYDKLLLTELGNDDEVLTARLVNNEALYFRREQPPKQPKLTRVLLIDTTIKMWGTSRRFAMAAALAASQQTKHFSKLISYCLGGTDYNAVNLEVKPGVIQALEKMDHGLHCGYALESVMASFSALEKPEVMLITEMKTLHDHSFSASLSSVKNKISFLLAVSASGEIILYQYINGARKQIGSAMLDIDEILSLKKKPIPKVSDGNLPQFMAQRPSPLYFPAIPLKISSVNAYKVTNGGVVVISKQLRVLYSNGNEHGGVELLSYIERGHYDFSTGSDHQLNIVVSDSKKNLLILYRIDLKTTESKRTDLIKEFVLFNTVEFETKDVLKIVTPISVFTFNCIASVITSTKNVEPNEIMHGRRVAAPTELDLKRALSSRRYFNSRSTMFYKAKDVYVNEDGNLLIGDYMLLHYEGSVYWQQIQKSANQKRQKQAKFIAMPQYRDNGYTTFHTWQWADGSTATTDSRGLLHLKSTDPHVPEITIVLIHGLATAMWAASGDVAGMSYYINKEITKLRSPAEFFNLYIHPFIRHLR